MYPASFFFEESSVAYVFLIVINLFTGITTVTASFMLEVFFTDDVSINLFTGITTVTASFMLEVFFNDDVRWWSLLYYLVNFILTKCNNVICAVLK